MRKQIITFRATAEEKRLLEQMAEEAERTISDLIRSQMGLNARNEKNRADIVLADPSAVS